MSRPQARFEICRGEDGYWVRYRAVNNRVVWVTENYERRRSALGAIASFVRPLYGRVDGDTVTCLSARDSRLGTNRPVIEIRDVDER